MAAIFTRNDLVYKDYHWTTYGSDDPRVSGPPDSTLLNRGEGYEMVYFINKFCEFNRLSVAGGQKAERLIRTRLPGTIKSQIAVRDWLVDNWNAFG